MYLQSRNQRTPTFHLAQVLFPGKCTHRTVTFGLHLISYVLTLETHVKLLARGIQGMYQLIQHGESLPGGPLQIDEAGNPLLHDILDRLGVLEGAQQHNTFQWNPAVVNRLVYSWETSQPNLLPLHTSAPEDPPNVWRSDQLSNHFTYNDTYDLDATIFNTVFDTTLNAVVDPAVDTVFNPTLSTDIHVEQEIKQNDWIMGLH